MTRVLTLAAAAALATGCGRIEHVHVTRTVSLMVPGDPARGTLPQSALSALSLDLGRNLLDQEGLDPRGVDGARVERIRLTVRSGASLETWLDAVDISIAAAGLPTVRIGSASGLSGLPAGTMTVELDLGGADLKDYVTAKAPYLVATASGRVPAVDTLLEIAAGLDLKVNATLML
jgi:hypothetical protein